MSDDDSYLPVMSKRQMRENLEMIMMPETFCKKCGNKLVRSWEWINKKQVGYWICYRCKTRYNRLKDNVKGQSMGKK